MIIKSSYPSVAALCAAFGLELKQDFLLIETEDYDPKAQAWVTIDGVKHVINMPLDIDQDKPVSTKVSNYEGGITGVWVYNPTTPRKLAFG